MKKMFFFCLVFLATTSMLCAVPAIKKPATIKQADGTSITVYLKGDESTKWYESLDGYSLLKKDGQFYYAVLDKNGNMVASKVKAHNESERTRQEKKLLRKTPQQLRYSSGQLKKMRAAGPVASANDPARVLANSPLAKTFKARKSDEEIVTRRAPIILINFADKQMTTPKENYINLINGTNYTENGCTGSFRDYFLDNSRRLFHFDADVIGPVTLSKNMAYYGGNDDNGNDSHPQEMAAEACRLASQQGVDFSKYDFDNDGVVDAVHIIYPGKGEEAYGGEDAIWSHKWNIYPPITLNGKTVEVYSCSAELSYSDDWACIGTIVHEMSHVFGLPDLYDTDYGESGGNAVDLDAFDVMSGGSYNGDSKMPPLHNAWSRIQMGWLTQTELDDSCVVRLYPAEQATHAMTYTTQEKGEYFVLDYRGDESKWDGEIPGYGMLVFAVNENVEMVDYPGYSAWDYNCINCDPDNRGFYIKQANGGNTSNARMGEGTPFPGSTGNRSFTDDTEPSSKSSTGKKTEKPITQIAEMAEGGISFVFIGDNKTVRDNMGRIIIGDSTIVVGQVEAPVFSPKPASVGAGTYVTITSATENAVIYYTTDGTQPTTSSTVYTSPIQIMKTTTFKAMATKENMENSRTVEAYYYIKPATVADPVFNPGAGEVEAGTKISISCGTEKATIRYTTNGFAPTESSDVYSEPIVINANTTIKARAFKENMENSNIVEARYTVKTTGTEKEELKGVKVYPNPNNGRFTVELPEKAEVSVFGMNGTLLKRQNLQEGRHELRLPEAGTYVLQIHAAKAKAVRKVTVR